MNFSEAILNMVDKDHFRACFILSAVGDAIGYRRGNWEFCKSGRRIHNELLSMTENCGVVGLRINTRNWIVSDDTVMHIATANGLLSSHWQQNRSTQTGNNPQESKENMEQNSDKEPLEASSEDNEQGQHPSEASEQDTEDTKDTKDADQETRQDFDKIKLFQQIAKFYYECRSDMSGRAPGACTMQNIHYLCSNGYGWDKVPFNPRGGGCGAAMRTMCIGLRFWREEDFHHLLSVSIESGRMTHNNPIGFLGGYVSALFTSFAVRRVDVNEWGWRFIDTWPEILQYLRESERHVKENMEHIDYFRIQWDAYLLSRHIGVRLVNNAPQFPPDFDQPETRDEFVNSVSYSGWGGSSGHDAPMIAYDALLLCGGDWCRFLEYGALHGGDNDSTGAIGGAWFGTLYGFHGVPDGHWENLEKKEQLLSLAERLFDQTFAQ